MVRRWHAIHWQVREVPDPDLLEAAHRVALLGEEDVVRLDRLEGQHPERVVGEEVEEEDVALPLYARDQSRGDGTTLDDEDEAGAPGEARALEGAQDVGLVRGLRAPVLVEGVVLAVLEGPDLVAEAAQLIGEVHPREPGPLEGEDDEPAHVP